MSNFRLSTLLLALAVGSPAIAQNLQRLPLAGADDLVASALVAAPNPGFNTERAPVQFAWKLDATQALQASAPYVDDSRQFWVNVSAAQMQRGYAIDTTAPGAVIRLSPGLDSDMTALSLDDLQLQVAGKTLNAAQAVEHAADADQMRQAGADFSAGTLAFRIRPELGAGRVSLKAAKAKGSYLLHVYEPNSSLRLRLAAARDSVVAGGEVAISARLYDGDLAIAAGRLGGLITAPDGRSIDLNFVEGADGSIVARAALPADAASQPGLWEVHTFATTKNGKARVLRDAKTAIAVAAPTARFAEEVGFAQGNGIDVNLHVQAAAEGRYQASGVLYGTDANGQLQPMAAAQSAAWLEAGTSELALHFGPEVLNAALRAPYAVRELGLADQTRMGQLERRAGGIENLGSSPGDQAEF
jgi:hypothetical protein